MPDKLPMGSVNPQFRGLEARLHYSAGAWWLEITPVPRTAEERLRRPWRSVYRVPFLGLEDHYTVPSFLVLLGSLCVEATSQHPADLEAVISR